MPGAALCAALGPIQLAGRLWLWTVTAPYRVLQAIILRLSTPHQRRLDNVFRYGPRHNADGSIERYDDGLVIIPGTRAAEIPSRLWIHLAGDTPEREEEQFDPMQKIVHEIERYRSSAAARVPHAPESEPAHAAGEQAVADAMTLRAVGLVGSNIEVRDEPVPVTGASRPGSGMLETTTQTAEPDEDDSVGRDHDVISLIVKEEDLPPNSIAHRDIVKNGGGAVREDEDEDLSKDPAKRSALERDPKPELSLANPAAPANAASEDVAHHGGNHADESPVPEYPAAHQLPPSASSSRRGSTKPPSLGPLPSPAPAASAGNPIPPLVWSERAEADALAKQQQAQPSFSPLPTASTPFNDDGSDWLTRDGSYFPAELHRAASKPPSLSSAHGNVEERERADARAAHVPPLSNPL